MKSAIYIEDGIVQLVLTPENDFEKNALGAFEKKPLAATIVMGQFYDCNGGWARHQDTPVHFYAKADRSLILRAETHEARNDT